MSINDLRAIVIGSPTEGAVNNALTILLGLARDGDFDALKAILQLLAHELGLDPDRPSLTDARSIQELLSASDVPPLLRVYATAFQPRDFLAQVNAVATLASEASSSRCFSAFQSLVRRHGALQHEALKAYVLIAFSGMNKMLHPQDRVGFISPGGQLAILDVILSNCRVVAGENADASLQFGHDLLLRLTGVDQFLSIIHHELGHNILDTVWGSPHSTTMRPYEDCLCEIASALPSLLDSACRLGGKPLQFGDPRSFKAASGVSILCTQVQHKVELIFTGP
jgi:hypothetical protein